MTGKFFLRPLYKGHTMNLGEKKAPNDRDKFGVGATYTLSAYKPFPRHTDIPFN